MATRTYMCHVVSTNSNERIYPVSNRSAMKAAKQYGRCEADETISIRTYSGHVLSCVKWDPQSNKYINVSF